MSRRGPHDDRRRVPEPPVVTAKRQASGSTCAQGEILKLNFDFRQAKLCTLSRLTAACRQSTYLVGSRKRLVGPSTSCPSNLAERCSPSSARISFSTTPSVADRSLSLAYWNRMPIPGGDSSVAFSCGVVHITRPRKRTGSLS